ncbi:unnamed protein product [Adineta steineri]|uniref:RING-type domain-containing protein n=1 Tax=Adineta steineri TaxID=433720 RepID=A0A819V662_9BILA|nr:unnamed protein product [Adineta steineri]CAF4103972.1 unnamed protein product [Adineta steineri]
MRAQDQIQPPPPLDPQLQTICGFCLDNIQPNETVIQCTSCHEPYHYSELITWLTIRRNNRRSVDCPSCRADMKWVLHKQQSKMASENINNDDAVGISLVGWPDINNFQLELGIAIVDN